ncbi:MAG: ATPase domain-containing protein [Candidatus Altiarchaeota archaeon]
MADPKVSTGIRDFDAMLGGGLYEGTNVLVKGKAGTGKTTVALQFLVEGARMGEKGAFLTFEESSGQLVFFGKIFFPDLDSFVNGGTIQVIDFSPHNTRGKSEERANSTSYIEKMIPEFKSQGIKRLVLDGLQTFSSEFFDLSELSDKKDTDALRRALSNILVILKKNGFTTYFLSEDSDEVPDPYGFVNFSVDGIISLSVNESLDLRIIRIAKMRGTRHTLKPMAIRISENDGVSLVKG